MRLNKPIYVGVAILDYSKLLMYKYHYGLFKKIYKDKIRLILTDTDSLFYHIKTDDVYKDLFGEDKNGKYKQIKEYFGKKLVNVKDYFDTSNFKKDSIYFSDEHKIENGLIKPENGDNIIEKVCSNKSKVYAFEYAEEYYKFLNVGDKSKLVRCKGTNRTTVKNEITINKLIDTVKDNSLSKNDNFCFRSKKHNIGLYKINKVSLSCYDDKRHILEDGITSYAHGHKNVKDFIKPLK